MKHLSLVAIALALLAHTVTAQLSGTKNIPGDYASLDAAITDLNTQGVGAGGVTLNLLAGNPQTAPAGGYVIGGAGSLVLTSSSAANPVLIVGNGNTITANAALTAGTITDAIFKLVGADWVTISGFTMQENPANTTTAAASNNMTEWGVALLHVSTTDGAQNNTIQNNNISLNRTYANSFGIYCNNRHSATSATVVEDTANNTTGLNSGNKIYGNIIGNVNLGMAFVGAGAQANMDTGNDIGGSSGATGNTLSNWGGAAPASSFISVSGTSFGIFMNHQTADNVSFNTLTSAAVSGTSVTFRGIFKDYTAIPPTGTFTSKISNNTVTMSSGFTSGTFEAIRSQGMTNLPTATININSNNVLNCVVSGAASSSAIVGIVNSSVPGILTMNYNTVRGNTSTATTGGFTGVSNSGAVTISTSMIGNHIGDGTAGAITFSAATSGAVLGVANTGGASTCALTMQNNDIRGIVHSVNGTSAHTYCQNTAATLSQNISGNTFTALSVATSGSVIFIQNSVSAPTGGFKTVSSNSIVTSFTKTVSGGTVTLYSDNASSVAGVIVNNNDNNFCNISVTGATTVAGWSNTDGGSPTKVIMRNTFTNWTGGTSAMTGMNINFGSTTSTTFASNKVSNITGGGAVTAVVFGSSIGTLNASYNTINALASTGASAVQGFTCASSTNSFFKNKIYDLQANNASGTVNGLSLLSGGNVVVVFNNLIADLRAPATSSTSDAIRGINITSTTSNSRINVYYNTIFISATSSGAEFSTSGLYHTASATATTAALDLRNNIIVNTSTPNGAGLTIAYRRSSGAASTLANYASTSDKNDFYAGTPGAANVIYYDGTSTAQTLGDYKAGAFTAGTVSPRDATSVSEQPVFLSTTGSSATFLHINASIPTALESGGISISGITDDFDGETRNLTTPDIGADEFVGTGVDSVPPSIIYTPLAKALPAANRVLPGFATITDNSGTVSGGASAPRFYFKKSVDADTFGVANDSTGNGWKYVVTSSGSSPYSFTVDYSLLTGGGVNVGDVIEYFVVAQDPVNLLGSNPSGAGASGNPPVQNVNSHGPLNSYLIAQPFAGTKTVAPGGADYTTLTSPGGLFDAINNGIVTNNLLILITDDLFNETGFVALNQTTESGPGNYTITIRPSGGPRTISGTSSGADAALIRLSDADRVIIDGSTVGATAGPGVGGNAALRELTIQNFDILTTASVLTLSSVANGAQNNILKNLNIVGYDSDITKVGISIGGLTAGTTGSQNHSNRIENCSVQAVITGIYSAGSSSSVTNVGLVIIRNDLSGTGDSRVSRIGIFVSNSNGPQITENSVGGIEDTTTSDAFGISLGTTSVSTSTTTGGGVINANVSRNKINGVSQQGTSSAVGIAVAGGAGVNTIANNMISGVIANSDSTDLPAGILVLGSTGSTNRLYHNSVSMTGDRGVTASQAPSYAIGITGTDPAVELVDNIFYNIQDGTGGGLNAKSYAIGVVSSTFVNLTSDYNEFYSGGPQPGYFRSGSLGSGAGTDYANLAAWRTGTARDTNSIEADPFFTAANDLHITGGSPAYNVGVSIPGINIDIDGEARDATPSIGADEPSGIGIGYTLLANATPAANRPIPNFAAVGSLLAPVAGGASAPRFYFKKSTDSDVFGVANNSSGNGWKYVVTSSGSSPYSFTIDYSLLTGGGVSVGDVIEYFVVAQDTGNVLASNPSGAGASGNPPVQNINSHGAVNSFLILPAFAGVRTVGPSGADYTGLTIPGGIFDAINSGVVTNNLTILITGDLTGETGEVALNETTESGAGNYTITIRPSGGPRTISGSINGSLIRLNDADRVVIDGSTIGATAGPGIGGNAALRELTIINLDTSTSNAVLAASGVVNGAQNNTFKNLNIVGHDSTTSKVGISIGGVVPGTVGLQNHSNRIENCSIKAAITGIYSAGSSTTVTNRGLVIIRNDLSTTGANRVSRIGIFISNDNGAQITENSIGGIEDTTTSDAFGITLGTTSVTTSTTTGGGVVNANVTRNKINGVSQLGTSSAVGIASAGGAGVNTIANNMISGVIANADSSDLVAGIMVVGASTATNRIYHNSVSMTGNRGVTTSQYPSYALAITGTDRPVEVKDNIFSNIQDPGAGGANAKSYAIGTASTTFINLDSDYNAFYSAGPLPGYFRSGSLSGGSGTDYANLAAWRAATGRDTNSIEADPLFNSATDLHISAASPALHAGVTIPGNATDFDGDARAVPPTIGADEPGSIGISYTVVGNELPAANRSLPGFATVVSLGAPVAGGASAPRFYFKKSTDADVFGVPNNSSGNGWKYVVTSSGSSPYSFTVDYSLLTGGGVLQGDEIEYFVVAQDTANVLASNPTGAGASGNPPVQNINSHGAVNSYLILQAMGGTKTVGPSGANYPSLTAAGGIFEAINNSVIASNLLILITGDLTLETGEVALNQTLESGAGNYTITIRPSGGPRTISGSVNSSLIRLNDADRVTIDGSTVGATAGPGVGGNAALRELTIINLDPGTSAAVLTASGVITGAKNNTFKNLNIVGADPTTTKNGISLGGGAAGAPGLHNDNNRIENCSVQKVITGIYSSGSSAAVTNVGLVIIRNDLSATEANRIRQVGIYIANDDGALITENSVGGIVATTSDAFGITLGTTSVSTTTVTGGGVINANVTRNKVDGVWTGVFASTGIAVAGGSGTNTVANNMISGINANSTSPDFPAGIFVAGVVGSTTRVYYNSIAMTGTRSTNTSQLPSYAIAITGTNPPVEIKDNIFLNTQDPGSGPANCKTYAIGTQGTLFGNMAMDYNVFFTAGLQPGYFRAGSLASGAGTDYPNLAAWRVATGTDANSIEANPLYTSATDLHITSSSPAFHTGVFIPGISIDIDGDLRSGTPNIGADELPGALVPVPFYLTGPTRLGDGSFKFAFSNLSGLSFTAFGTTNVAAPLNTWLNLGPAVETPPGSGQYQFTDVQATNNSRRSYRVRSP